MATTRAPDAISSANTPQKPKDDALVYNLREVAYLLDCSVATVRRRIYEGYPHTRRGSRAPIKVRREDLPHWIEAERIGPQPGRRRTPRRAS